MNSVAQRLIPRLIAIQLIVGLVTVLVITAFAPRLLLLPPRIVDGSFPSAIYGGMLMFVFVVAMTLTLSRRVRPLLRALTLGSSAVDPIEVLTLYALPARFAIIDVVAALGFSLFTLIPVFRPPTNDLPTQAALVLLTMTIVSASALPLYVMMRVQVGRVLEIAPYETTREAVTLLEHPYGKIGRVRQRLLSAVAAPVAFVALGASLLVYAHTRAQESAAREANAVELVRGTLELVDGDASGRNDAIAQAALHGYKVNIEFSDAPAGVEYDDEGQTVVTVPLDGGHASVRFETTRISPIIGVYFLLALVATALAGIIGSRIGAAFADDVALATREVRSTGVADIVRGTKVPRDARFSSISTLMYAIDELGGVFREFAGAQERSIEARAATERMRGLFLASMSHDLKSPLNSILGFAELVGRNKLSEGQRESLAIVEQRGRELLTLIQTILDSARVEAGELDVTCEWTMVGDVVMSAVLEARDLAVGTEVQVVGEIQPGVPRLYIDPTRVIQALTQVINSAVRFTDKGMVFVRATLPANADRLRIDVEGSGRGIPQAELEKIFEAFKYADRARRHGSLGLGLSLARSILEIQGGSIDIDALEGGGTVFHVWLPAPPVDRRSDQKGARGSPDRRNVR